MSGMNEKQRIMAAFRRQEVDRVPWCPRILLWYTAHKAQGTLPERYRTWDIFDIYRDLGVAISYRLPVFETRYRGVEIVTRQEGHSISTEYHTPLGTLRTRNEVTSALAAVGIHGYDVEKMLKEKEDYGPLLYLLEHAEIVPLYDQFEVMEKRIGNDGVLVANFNRSPLQDMMVTYAGIEKTFFELFDHPKEAEQLLAALGDLNRRGLRVALDSPAEVIISNDNFDGEITNPNLFLKYCAPYFREIAPLVHARGKLLASHLDGDPAPLLNVFHTVGIDIVDCFTPAPMTNVTTGEARAKWGKALVIWGGIPSSILCDPFTDEEFEAFVARTIAEIAPGDGIVMAVGDNVMPEAKIERVAQVARMVQEYARYPIPSTGALSRERQSAG